MSSQEIPIVLTPQQAKYGVILPVDLPSGAVRLRIPPCRDGELVRARVGSAEVLLRVRVSESAAGGAAGPAGATGVTAPVPGAAPKSGSGAGGCLAVVGVVAALIVAVVLVNSGDDDHHHTSSGSSASSVSTPAYTPSYEPPTYAPSYQPPTYAPSYQPPTYAPTPTEEAPSPFDRGTCLNGQLPDSTTPQSVSGVNEVSCSASDAHYKVIESIPFTTDMNRCKSNSRTEYAFSYSYTRNGVPLNQYVYCLVGLGSYAR